MRVNNLTNISSIAAKVAAQAVKETKAKKATPKKTFTQNDLIKAATALVEKELLPIVKAAKKGKADISAEKLVRMFIAMDQQA